MGWSSTGVPLISGDGDILTFSGTTVGDFIASTLNAPPINVNTTTSPYLICKIRADNPCTVNFGVGYDDLTSSTFVLSLTTKWQIIPNTMTAGKTITSVASTFIFNNQSVAGNIYVDYVAICGNTVLQLAMTDLEFGTVTRASLGFDHAELKLNNQSGKYVVGANAPGFADHIHIYLPNHFDGKLYHAYGGYLESTEPFLPPDEAWLYSRGWGLGPGRTLHLAQYTSTNIATVFQDMIDNFVNATAKNGVPIPSNYQLSRSYVQSVGGSLPIYTNQMQYVFNSWRELVDLSVANGSPVVFFVDPAENVHLVPLGTQGAANWTTDPFSANYPNKLIVGATQIFNQFRRDTQSVRNRVHYQGVAQTPGNFDGWTENTASLWSFERKSSNTNTPLIENKASPAIGGPGPVGLGSYSVHTQMVQTNNASATEIACAFLVPSTKDLHLDVSKMGSAYSPPLFDFLLRTSYTSPLNNPLMGNGAPHTIFFANDASNRFEYCLISDPTRLAEQSMLNLVNTIPTNNLWYHLLLPIGPNGGTLFLNPPILNGISPATYTGTSGYQLNNVGTPNWKDINYVGVNFRFVGNNSTGPNQTFDQYYDGWRIMGGRYRLTYDGRTVAGGRYRDMSEHHVWDPIAKGESLLQSYARAELMRLMNPIMRGNIHHPMLGNLLPEQQVQITAPSANLNNTWLRVTEVKHHFSKNGLLTDLSLSDDFTNSQPLERWKIHNAMMGMGDNAVIAKEVYDLKTALVDPGFTAQLEHWTGSAWVLD